MSSIGSISFSPAVQPNETGASQSKEKQTELLNKKMEELKKKKKDEEEEDSTLVKGPDGAIYKIEGSKKILVQPAPPSEDQINF